MDKRFLAILGGIIVIFGAIFVLSQGSDQNGGDSKGQPTSHIMGEGKKNITLMEYGDYECPSCQQYHAPLKQAVGQLSNDIYFQFRNLPLTAIHLNAQASARAAEAAGLQGKFWEMHDKLYENQTTWARASSPQNAFNGYAGELGLDVEQFKKDYASSKVNNAINADLAEFKKTGRDQATPTFFINGRYLPNSELVNPQTGAPDVSIIVEVIKAEIAKSNSY
ncbi:MAG: thioredoxin domain-containing protein [Candidatus Saccharimonadales bacterium]